MLNRTTLTAGSVSVLLAFAAVLGSGAASADPGQDDHFLALLDQKGVAAISGVPSLIATAHEICGNLDAGMSADAVVNALVDNANAVTPGADAARLARTETRFLAAAVEAYCPNNERRVTFTNPAGWSAAKLRVAVTGSFKATNPANPNPPSPGPQAENLTPPQAVAPPPPAKAAPPVVGPPPGGGGGGGGTGGGTRGGGPLPPVEPGIITLAP